MLALCELTSCRRQSLLAYFGENLEQPCGHCDNCIEPADTWDGSEAARMALSTIYRSGQRYGVGHLTDILLGRDNEKIRGAGHQHLSTYGIGKQLTEQEWRSVFRQLIARRLVEIDLDGFGSLRLAESCRPLLRGEESLALRKDIARSATLPTRKGDKPVIAEADRELWEQLRALRKRLADAQGVPPYVVFADSTLVDMLRQRPTTMQDMGLVSGIGAHKLERYGADFLQVLLGDAGDTGAAPVHEAQEIQALALSGMEPEQIARQAGLPIRQVYQKLAQAISAGHIELHHAVDLPPGQLERIQDLFLNDAEDDLPSVRAVAAELDEPLEEGVLHCIRAALVLEISG